MQRKRVLFVCSGNLDRSPTAEEMFRNLEDLEVRSAGILRSAPSQVSKELIEWADVIFAMEGRHKEAMLRMSPTSDNKIIVLNVPDIYVRNDPELKRILKEKLSKYL
jgi:predicted protein tyrosine phosphatase